MAPNSYRNFTCGKLLYLEFSYNLGEQRILDMKMTTQITKSSFCYFRKLPKNSYSAFINSYTNQSNWIVPALIG